MFENWKIAIIGAGVQGHSIGLAYALCGFDTTIVDTTQAALDNAKKLVATAVGTLVSMDEITQETADAAQAHLTYTTDLVSAVSQADMVQEAIFENAEAKKNIFDQIGACCKPQALLASNTSTLNIYEIVQVPNPQRLAIVHWCTPPYIMPLVEVVRGPQTSDETVETFKNLLLHIGKKPAVVNQVIPGFILNRIGLAIFREACYIAGQGWATPEDVDTALRNTYGIRWPFEGPLELRDYIGWDVSLSVGSFVIPHLCNSTTAVGTAVELTKKGWLGVKSGHGLKDYTNVDIGKVLKERNTKILKMKKAVRQLHEDFD